MTTSPPDQLAMEELFGNPFRVKQQKPEAKPKVKLREILKLDENKYFPGTIRLQAIDVCADHRPNDRQQNATLESGKDTHQN